MAIVTVRPDDEICIEKNSLIKYLLWQHYVLACVGDNHAYGLLLYTVYLTKRASVTERGEFILAAKKLLLIEKLFVLIFTL